MFSVGKATTQTWSKSAQEPGFKIDNTKRVGADVPNPFGDKKIGEIANEIVDPNYVDPKSVVREKKADLDKDAFFKLMLTQMKNQDPTNPMQAHEMAAQLAQFTSMEQLFNINKSLESLNKTAEPQAGFEAVNFIGKSIVSDSSKVVRTSADKEHELRFGLGGDATEVKVAIKDNSNQVVKEMTLGNLKKGQNKVVWNGMLENGTKAREGEYTVEFVARNSGGGKLAVETKTSGKITGVNFTAKGPVLMVGNQSVNMADIRKIEDLDLKKEQEKVEAQRPKAKSTEPIVQPQAKEPLHTKTEVAPASAAAPAPAIPLPVAPVVTAPDGPNAPTAAAVVPPPPAPAEGGVS